MSINTYSKQTRPNGLKTFGFSKTLKHFRGSFNGLYDYIVM